MRLDHLLSRENRRQEVLRDDLVCQSSRSNFRVFESVRYFLSFWSLGLGASLAGTPAGLDSSELPAKPGSSAAAPRERGLSGESHPSGLNLLRNAEVWACSSVG